MDRRLFIASLATLPFAGNALAEPSWQAKFLSGRFLGASYQAGLHVKLAAGWKTYWRNPGEAGIPPSIEAKDDNLADLKIDFPLPTRLIDESGEAIGFHDEVLFPLYLTPKDKTKPLVVKFSAFFGVCQQICTPAKLEEEISFTPDKSGIKDAMIEMWQARVPKPADFVSMPLVQDGHLVLNIKQNLDDLFVEGPDRYYFRKPNFEKQAGKAWIKIDGLKNPADLVGVDLRITASAQKQGLEQHVMLA
jgi:DsbC/DsbD-like thiol-disulfide interchange protein